MTAMQRRPTVGALILTLGLLVGLVATSALAAPGDNNASTPYRSLYTSTSPHGAIGSDAAAVTLGVKFNATVSGYVDSVEFYRGSTANAARTVTLWSATGTQLATATTANASTLGFVWGRFNQPVHVTAGATYVASYFVPAGGSYNGLLGGFSSSRTVGPLTAPVGAGVYTYGSASTFPTSSYQNSEYLVSPVFVADVGGSPTTTTTVPSTTTTTPATTTTLPVTTTTTLPATTTTTTPGAQLNCMNSPHICGYPDNTNTGVPAGTVLTTVGNGAGQVSSGPGWTWNGINTLTIDGSGVASGAPITLDALDVHGQVRVTTTTNQVTISRCRITNPGDYFGVLWNGTGSAKGPDTITDSTVAGTGPASTVTPNPNLVLAGLKSASAGSFDEGIQNITRVDVGFTGSAIQTQAGTISDSWIHDIGLQTADNHLNGFSRYGGNSQQLNLVHNTIDGPNGQTDSVALFNDAPGEHNATMDYNLWAGGNYTIYGGLASATVPPGSTSNIRFTNNRFSRKYFPTGGSYGYGADFGSTDPGNAWTGNIWDDTGAAIPIPGPY